jgi:hypothetical protein
VVLVDFDLDDGKGTELVRELTSEPGRPVAIAVPAHADGNAALVAAGAGAGCGKLGFGRVTNALRSLTGNGPGGGRQAEARLTGANTALLPRVRLGSGHEPRGAG